MSPRWWAALVLIGSSCNDDSTEVGEAVDGSTDSSNSSSDSDASGASVSASTTDATTALDSSSEGTTMEVSTSADGSTEATTWSTAETSTVGTGTTETSTGDDTTETSTDEGPACMLPDETTTTGDDGVPLDLGVLGGCGNQIVEEGEICDDGNLEPGDGCEPDCTSSDDVPPEWTLTMGGPNTYPDCGSGVAFDSQGNLIIAGFVAEQVWIRKYDTSYVEQWTVTYPGWTNALCTDTVLGVDSLDNIAFAGVLGIGQFDADWIVGLLDPDGMELWTDTFNGPISEADYTHGLAVDSQDSIVVVGEQENPDAGTDAVLRKYSNDGALLWSDIFSTASGLADPLWAVDTDPCDAIVVSGAQHIDDQNWDVVVRKYDTDGGLVWERTPGSGLIDWGKAIAVDAHGAVTVGGAQQAENLYLDFWLLRYDADGNEIWSTSMDGGAGGHDEIRALLPGVNGGFWAAGTIAQEQFSNFTWLRRYDAGGNVIWTRITSFPGSSNGWLAIARAPDGRLAAAGLSQLPFPNDAEAHFAVYPP